MHASSTRKLLDILPLPLCISCTSIAPHGLILISSEKPCATDSAVFTGNSVQSLTLSSATFVSSSLSDIWLTSWLEKYRLKTYKALSPTKSQKAITNPAVGTAALIPCWTMLTLVSRGTHNFSQFKSNAWKSDLVPSAEVVPLSVVNISDWARLMCRCLQPQAKLQHYLEAGLALPSEWASFPEHLSD